MPQYRNITDEVLWTVTDTGLIKVEPESVITVSDDWATAVYFQTGDTGETPIWEPVTSSKKKSTTPSDPPAAEPSDN